MPGVRHEQIAAGELRTHVALAGPEDAPAILLVHGWPQNWWAWRGVIPELAERFRVIVPDLRGHGWSEAPARGYEKQQLACDLLALLDAMQIERASWVGHDWGAWSGFLAALHAPERIERMLALCVPHPWAPPHPSRVALLGYQLPISLPVLGRRLAGPMTRAILQTGRGAERLGAGDVAMFSERIPARVSVAMYRTFLTRELIPTMRGLYAESTLRVPTTLLCGGADIVTRGLKSGPVEHQPELAVSVIDGVAHWLPEQRPQAVLDWARSIDAAPDV